MGIKMITDRSSGRERRTATKRILRTGCEGFDDVLNGGFSIGLGRSTSIVIKGKHGAGKTTVASQISSAMFKHGIVGDEDRKPSVAYFSLEQRASDIKSAVGQFDWAPNDWDDVAVVHEDFEQPVECPHTDDPQFVICQYPFTALEAMERIDDQSAALPQQIGLTDYIERVVSNIPDCGLIVVDSLSDPFDDEVFSSTESYRLRRTLFQELCSIGEKFDATVIVLLEKNDDVSWRDYVADVVVELGWREDRDGELHRYLQVEKSRFQESLDGRHELRIKSGTGIVVFPLLTEVLRRCANRMQQAPANDLDSKMVSFCTHDEFNRMLDRGKGLIAEGSVSLLYGPDATRKKAVVTQFLHEGVRDQWENEGHVIFLAAGNTPAVAKQMLEKYIDRKLVSDEFREVEEIIDRIKIVPVTAYFASVNELAYTICCLARQYNVVRLTFDDVAAYHGDPADVLPIRELCAMKGITSLFVHTVEQGEESPIREHFDTFIRCRHLVLPNNVNVRVGYQVQNINGATKSDNRSWELSFKDERLVVVDAFTEYVEDKSGHLYRLPMGIFLYGEYKETKKFWEEDVAAVFGSNNTGREDVANERPDLHTFINEQIDPFLSRYLALATHCEMATTWIGSVDEPWFNHLVEEDKLVPLDRLLDDAGISPQSDRAKNPFHPLAWERGQVDGVQYGIPHRLDFGLYSVRADLVTAKVLHHFNYPADKVDWTWEEMLEVGRVAQRFCEPPESTERRHRAEETLGTRLSECPDYADVNREPPPIFDFLCILDESILCLGLEAIWPFLFDKGNYQGFEHPRILAAVKQLYSTLRSMNALAVKENAAPAELSPRTNAIFKRNWFVSHWKHQRDFVNGDLRIINPPSMCLPGENQAYQAATLGGEWYLSLFKGSPNPGRGFWAMRALTSEQANQRLYEKRVGLPANKLVLQTSDAQKHCAGYEKTHSRREIPNYHKIRPRLLNALRQIFGRDDESDERIALIWGTMLQTISNG